MQTGDVAGNWLRAAQAPWEGLKEQVAGSGSPAESLFNALGVEMPERQPQTLDQQMLDIMTATMAPTAASLKMPEGFFSKLERDVASGSFGKQQFGDYPKAGSLFKAAQRQGTHPDELAAIAPLKDSQQRVHKSEVLRMVDEGVPQLEKKTLGKYDEVGYNEAKTKLDKLYAEDSDLALKLRQHESVFNSPTAVSQWFAENPNVARALYHQSVALRNDLPPSTINSLLTNINHPSPENFSRRSVTLLNELIKHDRYLRGKFTKSPEEIRQAEAMYARRQAVQSEIAALHDTLDKVPKSRHEAHSLDGPRENYRENLWYYDPKSGSYQEAPLHYPDEQGKNLLMWSRVHDRQLVSGERVAYLDEAQSGWHSRGFKEGYAGPQASNYNITREPAALEQGRGEWLVHDNAGEFVRDFPTEEQARNYVDARGKVSHRGVPDAPLKTDWYKPLMRDLVADAVTKGLDGVTWSTEAIQSKRWPHIDPVQMAKNKAFYKKLYDEAIPKFMKSEYGVVPVKKKTVVGSRQQSLDITGDTSNGFHVIYRNADNVDHVAGPFYNYQEAAQQQRLLSEDRMMKETEDIWYIPLTPAVRQRIEREGQRLTKREDEPNVVAA